MATMDYLNSINNIYSTNIMLMERTEAHKKARLAAEEAGTFLEPLTYSAISSGIFKKPGKDDNYSFSWVIGRLKYNDMKVAQKLIKFATKI